jgi:hypothetical protein
MSLAEPKTYRPIGQNVQAVQFTKDMAEDYFLRDQRGPNHTPFGLGLGGDYHRERGEVYRAYIYFSVDERTAQSQSHATFGDWILKHPNGKYSVMVDNCFQRTYEEAQP